MNLHYSQTNFFSWWCCFYCFTTLWIYTTLKLQKKDELKDESFTTLWIYTTLKLKASGDISGDRFTTLWIYTTLKLFSLSPSVRLCFTTLWIYTTLKPNGALLKGTYGFTTLWIYTTLKRICERYFFRYSFYYLMNLHYSQTHILLNQSQLSFTTLWIYTTLKRNENGEAEYQRFTTLWIYTTLKRLYYRFFLLAVLLPYEFTLLSNLFVTLILCLSLFYYLMNLHYSQTW